MARRCPHANIVYCPLYHAAHIPHAGGCDDGELDTGLCAVDRRRLNYRKEVELLRVHQPGLVERLAFDEDEATRCEQRARNMRLSGIH